MRQSEIKDFTQGNISTQKACSSPWRTGKAPVAPSNRQSHVHRHPVEKLPQIENSPLFEPYLKFFDFRTVKRS